MVRIFNKVFNGKKFFFFVKLFYLIIDVIIVNYCICLFGDEKKLIMVVFVFNFLNIFGK